MRTTSSPPRAANPKPTIAAVGLAPVLGIAPFVEALDAPEVGDDPVEAVPPEPEPDPLLEVFVAVLVDVPVEPAP